MSHRKVHSQGSIPFSWEDKPGVCKTPNHEYPSGSLEAIKQLKSYSTLPLPPPTPRMMIPANEDMKIPLPPCPTQAQPPPRRNSSRKGFRLLEDPFLVAYKECTKTDKMAKLPGQNKASRKTKHIFSCKSSRDVKDDNFLKLSQLPRLPRDRNRSLAFAQEQKRDFKYEAWF